MALTNTTIRNLKPQQKLFKKANSKGLYMLVTAQGSKPWRLKYRFANKEKCLSLGSLSDFSLKEARKERDRLRALLARGIDPGMERKVQKAAIRPNPLHDHT